MSVASELFEQFGAKKVQDIRNALRANDINATGRLSASVQSSVTETDASIRVQVSALAYIGTVDVGRAPTKNRTGEFKVSDIETWITAKRIPIPAGLTLQKFARAIYFRINKYGTVQYGKPQRNIIRDAIDLGIPEFLEDVAKIGLDVVLTELAKWQRL